MEPKLGQQASDKITGFSGIVTGVCYYLSGCNQALLMPRVKEDGSLKDACWFDFQRLELSDEPLLVLDNSKTPGADMPAPIR